MKLKLTDKEDIPAQITTKRRRKQTSVTPKTLSDSPLDVTVTFVFIQLFYLTVFSTLKLSNARQ